MAKKPAVDPTRQRMIDDLARSGLTDDDARRMRLRPLAAPETRKTTGGKFAVPSYEIPYFELDGKPNCFSRLRFLSPVRAFGEKKDRRYWQAVGSPVRTYLPPFIDWRAIAFNPAEQIYVTEGEKKAAAATRAGLPTIGLGGVWSWMSKKASQPLIADLEIFAWKARPVTLVFDSDPEPKPEVNAALVQLAKTLAVRGAIVNAVTLPTTPGQKTGIDDYLVEHDTIAFNKLPREEIIVVAELLKLNDELAYIKDVDRIFAIDTEQFHANRNQFVGVTFAHRTITVIDANSKPRELNLAAEWLKWPRRRTYSALTYAPGGPRVDPKTAAYNLWRGWPAEPRKGDLSLFHELVNHIFADESPEHKAWFLKWAAYPIQYPGTKLYTAAVFQSTFQGVGKTLLGITLGAIYGADNFSLIAAQQLHGAFNAWQRNKQLIVGEEITGTDKRQDADTLKHLITSDTVHINEKFKPVHTLPNCANYFFTTNHPDAFLLDADDRRYFVVELIRAPLPAEFFQAYDAWLKSPAAVPALFHYFLHEVDVTGFDPRGPAPVTTAKLGMIDLSGTDADRIARELAESPDAMLVVGGQRVERSLYTLSELGAILDLKPPYTSLIALSRALRRAGFFQLPVTKIPNRGSVKLWAIRDRNRWRVSSHAVRVADYTGTLNGTPPKKPRKPKF